MLDITQIIFRFFFVVSAELEKFSLFYFLIFVVKMIFVSVKKNKRKKNKSANWSRHSDHGVVVDHDHLAWRVYICGTVCYGLDFYFILNNFFVSPWNKS